MKKHFYYISNGNLKTLNFEFLALQTNLANPVKSTGSILQQKAKLLQYTMFLVEALLLPYGIGYIGALHFSPRSNFR